MSAAAAPFRGGSWRAAAVAEFGVELMVVDLPDDVQEGIRAAQRRQFRANTAPRRFGVP